MGEEEGGLNLLGSEDVADGTEYGDATTKKDETKDAVVNPAHISDLVELST